MSFVPIDPWIFTPPKPQYTEDSLNALPTEKPQYGLAYLPLTSLPASACEMPVYFRNSAEREPRFMIVYAHGNAGDLRDSADFATMLQKQMPNAHVVGVEYPGYGLYYNATSWYPTAHGAVSSLKVLLNYIQNVLRWPEENIILIGHSVGTGVVSQCLTPDSRFAAVYLISPFTSIKDEVAHLTNSFVSWLVPNELDSYSRICKYNKPLLIVHGKKDTLIPVEQGVRLFNDSPSTQKELIMYDQYAHNDLPLDQLITPLVQFLDKFNIQPPLPSVITNGEPKWNRTRLTRSPSMEDDNLYSVMCDNWILWLILFIVGVFVGYKYMSD